MHDPSFGCDWETIVIAEYRNSEMYTWLLDCPIILNTVKLVAKVC